MIYPSIQKYTISLLSYSKTLHDFELKQGKLKKTPLGAPLALCGGFALTYQIECVERKYALRCFHKHSERLEDRYAAISRKLSRIGSKYFVDFEYQKDGILVDGSMYPIVKMEWAKGCSLAEFLGENYKSARCMANLRNSLFELAKFLELNNIAHGDIQPGNLMIADEGKHVQLIDYDGMFVDEIANLGASETGHRNFQHPKRDNNTWNASLDRFSFIQLYLSLMALENEPSLWTETKSDADSLLFRANDLAEPECSPIFVRLKNIKELKLKVDRFKSICLGGINNVPSLNEFLGVPQQVEKSSANKNLSLKAPHGATQQAKTSSSNEILSLKESHCAPQQSATSSSTRNTSSGYLSAFHVLNGNDFNNCLDYVGERVEIVARIFQVKVSLSWFRPKYALIYFDDWKGNCLRLAIWGSILTKFKVKPDDSWVGRWVSIVGLIEPTFSNLSSSSMVHQLSIYVSSPNEIHFITEDEAFYRMGLYDDCGINDDTCNAPNCHKSVDNRADIDKLKKNNDDISNLPWKERNLKVLEKIRNLRNR